jgi:hypothetical protein
VFILVFDRYLVIFVVNNRERIIIMRSFCVSGVVSPYFTDTKVRANGIGASLISVAEISSHKHFINTLSENVHTEGQILHSRYVLYIYIYICVCGSALC